ncbi:MAG: NAD(P)/FAD-dependent oxidoreductase [Bacteroidota bacterium]
MTKREFLKNAGILGMTTPFLSTLLASCRENELFFPDFSPDFTGKVLIIGAGAAGITAGHILHKHGIDFQILEAAATHGGRVKKAADFADFPIDLGGEWIHTDPSILAKLNNDDQAATQIEIITYNPQTISTWHNDKLRRRNFASNFYSEYKFKNSTWFDFFDELMVAGFPEQITYNSPVTTIDYTSNQVTVTNTAGDTFLSDKVLVTVPISILQSDDITFLPSLPAEKQAAIDEERMPNGIKVFIEFSKRFYPDIILAGGLLSALNSSDFAYYDAAFGKDSDRHIFALFAVGEKAEPYASLPTDEAIIAKVLGELDEMFSGQATQHYVKHIVQNWSREPFIRGSYSQGWSDPETLARPVNDRIFFAGEAMALTGNTSTVHGAAESAYEAVQQMLT